MIAVYQLCTEATVCFPIWFRARSTQVSEALGLPETVSSLEGLEDLAR